MLPGAGMHGPVFVCACIGKRAHFYVCMSEFVGACAFYFIFFCRHTCALMRSIQAQCVYSTAGLNICASPRATPRLFTRMHVLFSRLASLVCLNIAPCGAAGAAVLRVSALADDTLTLL